MACSPSFLAISRAVFLSRSIMERNSDGRNVLNDTAGFFDPGAEFFGLDHFLGRGGERINDRLGRAGGDEGAGPAIEIISFDPQLRSRRNRGEFLHLVTAHKRQGPELARAFLRQSRDGSADDEIQMPSQERRNVFSTAFVRNVFDLDAGDLGKDQGIEVPADARARRSIGQFVRILFRRINQVIEILDKGIPPEPSVHPARR